MILKSIFISKKNDFESGKAKAKALLESFQTADANNEVFSLQFYESGSRLALAFSDKCKQTYNLSDSFFMLVSADEIKALYDNISALSKCCEDQAKKLKELENKIGEIPTPTSNASNSDVTQVNTGYDF